MTDPARDPNPADEDAVWREIVENYGERPMLADAEPESSVPQPEEPTPDPVAASWADEGHYIPPDPPPVGFPTGARAVAWFGIFGGPALILLLMVFSVIIPGWFAWLVILGFIGSFGFLVSSRRQDSDGWDDGAAI